MKSMQKVLLLSIDDRCSDYWYFGYNCTSCMQDCTVRTHVLLKVLGLAESAKSTIQTDSSASAADLYSYCNNLECPSSRLQVQTLNM